MKTTKHTWTKAEVAAWFAGRIPDGWFVEAPTVRTDREEILVTGTLPAPAVADPAADAADDAGDPTAVAEQARIAGFREDTRAARMRIADEAELLWGRKVSWAARSGATEQRFTTQSVPVMTRLRMDEREVLDTFIESGVARSRSEALAWCVRLVGEHQSEWLAQLREALAQVERVRAAGPDAAPAEDPTVSDDPEA